MFFNFRSRTNGLQLVAGSFAPNGSSAVAATSVKGSGFSVARSGAGVFVVTLTKAPQFYDLVAANVNLHMGTPTGAYVTMTTHTLGTTGTVTLTAILPDEVGDALTFTATDVAAHATNRIDFALFLRPSKRVS